MALVLAVLCWPTQYYVLAQSPSSASALALPDLLASSTTAHDNTKPDDSHAAPTSAGDSSSHRPDSASATPTGTSQAASRGAKLSAGTHRPHLVTLSSTTVTVHPPHPTSPPPEQVPHAQPPQRPQQQPHPPPRHTKGGLIAGIREMAERERDDLARRVHQTVSFRVRRPPPPPPYQHAPAYDAVEGEDAAMVQARSATPTRAEFPPPDEPPPPATETDETTSGTRIDERRRSGDGRHAAGSDLV
ncbi:hypothetical protein PHLGIDRAFT_123834 [Phlebiopsis gigantea 11061_1 CR5-6]|uniref:Uncharacterized protein n=1 Tax=Phlebiopsis gigantea (strain 11061_1 CR5-6) TaxID=745531 RepID=A0A0C3S820_PHLG1|nr:hypothetical protein PHLGIDRAFT_123834 [Phlebiopsis gigantea 11061_1 CR5-6]